MKRSTDVGFFDSVPAMLRARFDNATKSWRACAKRAFWPAALGCLRAGRRGVWAGGERCVRPIELDGAGGDRGTAGGAVGSGLGGSLVKREVSFGAVVGVASDGKEPWMLLGRSSSMP